MQRQSRQFHSRRTCRGQGIVETAAALIVIIMVFVGGVAMIADFGTYVCYKIRVSAIADAAAQYAADQTYWLGSRRPLAYFSDPQIQTLTDKVVTDLLTNEGLLDAPVNAPITSDTANGVCSVTVTAANLPMPIPLGIFPQSVSIVETAAAPYPNERPIAVLNANFTNGSVNSGIILPTYGMFAGTQPGYTDITAAFAGTPPTTGTHNPYPGSKFPFWITGIYQTGPSGP
jgi:hypothetical protein